MQVIVQFDRVDIRRPNVACSVENVLCSYLEDHEVVGQHAQEALAGLRLVTARTHGRAHEPFALADGLSTCHLCP